MADGLSSNWKKLQARIKAESPPVASSSKSTTKRKAEAADAAPFPLKRQRLEKPPARNQSQSSRSPKPPRYNTKPEAGAGLVKSQMGVTQSSAVTRGTAATVTPSLALWAEDNDISPEDLAEAYDLGGARGRSNASLLSGRQAAAAAEQEDRARANEGLAPPDVVASLGRYVAVDCEMVGVGPEGRGSALARVTLVDFHGRQVYDSLVRPRERVTDWRTAVTGLGPRHMRGDAARGFEDVQREVAELLGGDGAGAGGGRGFRILVGHDVRHDLEALELSHPAAQIRDTARFSGYRRYGHGPRPALRVLAREVLGLEIQNGHHSSLEDARVAMLLFRKRKPEFDVEHANKYGRIANAGGRGGGGDGDGNDGAAGTRAKPQGKKKKKKKKH